MSLSRRGSSLLLSSSFLHLHLRLAFSLPRQLRKASLLMEPPSRLRAAKSHHAYLPHDVRRLPSATLIIRDANHWMSCQPRRLSPAGGGGRIRTTTGPRSDGLRNNAPLAASASARGARRRAVGKSVGGGGVVPGWSWVSCWVAWLQLVCRWEYRDTRGSNNSESASDLTGLFFHQ